MAHVSLYKNIRSCKPDPAWASKLQSDRFLNPDVMVCPVWNGLDTTARQVCEHSFKTKREGCDSALDRVEIENNVSRPQYIQYVTLNAEGIRGGQQCEGYNLVNADTVCHTEAIKTARAQTGQFGNDFTRHTTTNCLTCSQRR